MLLPVTLAVLGASYFFSDQLPLKLKHKLGIGSQLVVDLGYVKYLGNQTSPDVIEYRGIPYTEPPLGPLRFRAPVPLNKTRVTVEAGGNVVNATQWAEPCVQGTMNGDDEGGAGSEDCLKLNIVVPQGAKKGSNLPVLFYMHGGGYTFGNPANFPFTHWPSPTSQFIAISPAYRLSSFGFLSHPSMPQEDLNAGVKDLVAALRWIQAHIGDFGGDKGKVTIMGHSAGGSLVELLLVAKGIEKEGQDLFWAAAPQSVYRTPVPKVEQQVDLFEFYTKNVGCTQTAFEERMECLRKAPVNRLARAQDKAYLKNATPPAYHIFRPVVDGHLITDYPIRLIRGGEYKKVPLLIGATTNETSSEGTDLQKELTKFFPALTKVQFDTINSVYPKSEHAPENIRFQTITGEAEFRCSVSLFADTFSAEGVPTWTYRFDEHDPMSTRAGAGHAAENWFMFKGTENGPNGTTTFHSFTAPQAAFEEEIIAYLSSFIRVRNPNMYRNKRSPQWPEYGVSSPQVIDGQAPLKGREDTGGWRRARLVLRQAVNPTAPESGIRIEEVDDIERRRCSVVAAAVEGLQN